jgi:hypothetical protein
MQFGLASYRLPVNVEGVWQVLTKQRAAGKVERKFATKEQATRTAWRILREWIAAQMAILEAGMVTLDEVMLPYALGPSGKTVYQEITADQLKLLASGEEVMEG